MPDLQQAQELYKSGMELYGKRRYEEALSAFDRATSLGDKSWKVMDAKAATMCQMGGAWRQSAFETASALCQKYGDKKARPWYRAASILVALGMIDAANRSIAKGLGLTKDAATRKSFLDLQAKGEKVRMELEVDRATSALEDEAAREAQAKAKLCFTHLLTPDVLLLIAEQGVQLDADLPLRMAGVCSKWRAVVTSRPGVWSHLRLGRRRPDAKAMLWMECAKGRVRQVTLTNRVPQDKHTDVAAILHRCMPRVEQLTISDDPRYYVPHWRKLCAGLKHLVVTNGSDSRATQYPFLFGLFGKETVLETVDIGFLKVGTHLPMDGGGDVSAEDRWLPEKVESLRTLRIRDGYVLYPSVTLANLLTAAPNLTEIQLGHMWLLAPETNAAEVEVDAVHLQRLELKDRAGVLHPTQTINLPALTAFSCYNWSDKTYRPIQLLRGVGLSAALPNLVSLDLGRCYVAQGDLMDTLRHMKSLRFLNASFLGLNNEFMEALVVEEGKPALLPSLTALSIAGHETLSTGPLRRVVLSRAGELKKREDRAKVKPQPVRSAFAPAKRKLPEPTVTKTTFASQSITTSPVAPITWICADQCNQLDVAVLDSLRKHLRFVSNHNSYVEDRMRGRGAYAWDRGGDWDDACRGAMGGDGCHLRKRRADDDGWYVHHTCKKARDEERGECTLVLDEKKQ